VRAGLVLLLALVLAGCGEGGREHGTATLWVTEDRGSHVVFAGSVPAGLNGIQTVERKLKVTTRYGGRYLQSVNGVSGSLRRQRDWFFFVNGIEGDRSAAEVRLRPGDVLWWDYRHWSGGSMSVPVVVGAYPEPFLHAGPTSVVGADPALARRIARQVHGTVNDKQMPRSFVVVGGRLAPGTAHIRRFRGGYLLELGLDVARKLARDPHALRFRY
jgi:hypothetical protein